MCIAAAAPRYTEHTPRNIQNSGVALHASVDSTDSSSGSIIQPLLRVWEEVGRVNI